MSRFIVPVAIAVLLFALAVPAPAQEDLAAAKDLYTAAKYEEALAVLDRLKDAKPATADAALGVEQYRAMCLLALNRKADAERAIEAVADLDPFYQPAEDDAAPWVRAAFRESRRKVLPSALQRLYGHAKEAYNKKDMTEAVTAFGRVLKILDDPDLTLDKAAQGDLKMVAQGFMDLAQAAASAPPPAAQPPAAPPLAPASPPPGAPGPGASKTTTPATPTPGDSKTSAPAAPTPATPGPGDSKTTATPAAADAPAVYDVASKDVTPPLPVRRDVPSSGLGPRATPGTAVIVEVIVRETGAIESVVVRQSAGKYYDEMVTQAARNWLYRPALKSGQPVKYRLLVKVVIGRPTEPQGEPAR
jgi:TonB family protein